MLSMLHWAGRLRVPLVLLTLLAAVVTPVVTDGYFDIGRARGAWVQGKYSNAGAYYEKAAIRLPWKPRLWDAAGFSYALAGDWQHAVPLLEYSRKRGLLSINSWILYGMAYCCKEQDHKSLDIWTAGLRQYPDAKVFYYWLAWGYRNLPDYTAEQQALGVLVSSVKVRAAEHYRLGQLLMVSDPDRARTELGQAAELDANDGPAVETLEAALDLAARETDASRRLVILGRSLGLVNDWPLAEDRFQQAVNADARNAEAWAWLGEARQQNGQDGKPALDAALVLDPNSTLVHGLRGLYWKRQGKYLAQIAEYTRAAQLDPENPEWQSALGEAYTSKGDLVSGLASYQKATSMAPTNPTYWRLLAIFCADNGIQVLEVGLPAAKKAAALAPDDPQVLDALGWSYAQAGLLYNAEQTLVKARDLAPYSASIHQHLAETYLRKGDQTAAYSELQAAAQPPPAEPAQQIVHPLFSGYSPPDIP